MRIPGLGRAKRVNVPAPRRPSVPGRWVQVTHYLTDPFVRVWTADGMELIPPTRDKEGTTDVLLPLGHTFIIRVNGYDPDGRADEYVDRVTT